MLIPTTPAEMHAACGDLRRSNSLGPTVLGLVPTMGALHAGHLSLVSAAVAECDAVAVSIFVNPTQFGPNEDYAAYPRTFDEDCRKLEAAGVPLLFAPSAAEMCPRRQHTFVDTGDIGTRLDGASRPGHFRGVATIVARLFHIVAPDRAYFGQKDAAQVAVLRRMVRDLNFPIHLAVCPIFREPDGLALSSRNRYLSPAERQRALILSRALRAAASPRPRRRNLRRSPPRRHARRLLRRRPATTDLARRARPPRLRRHRRPRHPAPRRRHLQRSPHRPRRPHRPHPPHRQPVATRNHNDLK